MRTWSSSRRRAPPSSSSPGPSTLPCGRSRCWMTARCASPAGTRAAGPRWRAQRGSTVRSRLALPLRVLVAGLRRRGLTTHPTLRACAHSPAETDSEDEAPAAAPPKPVFRPKGVAAPAPAADEEVRDLSPPPAPAPLPPPADPPRHAQSSEYETDSEEEEPLKPLYKPVFVSKCARLPSSSLPSTLR